VWRVGLEQDRVAGVEPMGVARDVDLDRALGDDEVLGRAGGCASASSTLPAESFSS
jgi:hypothetical protein